MISRMAISLENLESREIPSCALLIILCMAVIYRAGLYSAASVAFACIWCWVSTVRYKRLQLSKRECRPVERVR